MVSEKISNQIKNKGFMNFTLSSILGATMLTGLGGGALFGAYEYGKSAGYQEYQREELRKLRSSVVKQDTEKSNERDTLRQFLSKLKTTDIEEYLLEGNVSKALLEYDNGTGLSTEKQKEMLHKITEYRKFQDFLTGDGKKISSNIERLQSKIDLLYQKVSEKNIQKIVKDKYFTHEDYKKSYTKRKIIPYVEKLRKDVVQSFKQSVENESLEPVLQDYSSHAKTVELIKKE